MCEVAQAKVKINALPRGERLRGEIRIGRVFQSGQSFFVYPFRCVYTIEPVSGSEAGVEFLISVPKKNHRRANKRNLLKRRVREAYRTQKGPVVLSAAEKHVKVSLALIFSTKDILDFRTIKDAVGKIVEKIGSEI